ncbi:hypothetical protein AO380_1961 [Moraxella catarrhalis]|nr:hypothetical protein AO380_1961 [Moraxella catarrhalis]
MVLLPAISNGTKNIKTPILLNTSICKIARPSDTFEESFIIFPYHKHI